MRVKLKTANPHQARSHRSSVGMHNDLASADKVWVPTEDHGNQKIVGKLELPEQVTQAGLG
jgi:hypothetical protein